jgi:hypothetical protein
MTVYNNGSSGSSTTGNASLQVQSVNRNATVVLSGAAGGGNEGIFFRAGGLENTLSQGSINYFNFGSLMTFITSSTEAMRIIGSGDVGIGTSNPTTALEVSGTISATHFVGDGSGLTGIAGVSGTGGDRIVSGSVSVMAQQTSGTVRVSGTLALVNTGNEVCDSTKWYSFRVNPSTGMMQMCRP